jgi:hypothetical protein
LHFLPVQGPVVVIKRRRGRSGKPHNRARRPVDKQPSQDQAEGPFPMAGPLPRRPYAKWVVLRNIQGVRVFHLVRI